MWHWDGHRLCLRAGKNIEKYLKSCTVFTCPVHAALGAFFEENI
jgi:hypothetical protein